MRLRLSEIRRELNSKETKSSIYTDVCVCVCDFGKYECLRINVILHIKHFGDVAQIVVFIRFGP